MEMRCLFIYKGEDATEGTIQKLKKALLKIITDSKNKHSNKIIGR